jgi:hypothetical protein
MRVSVFFAMLHLVWQREHLWELWSKSVGDSVTGVAEGALVGVSVFFVMLHMVWQKEHLWELRSERL